MISKGFYFSSKIEKNKGDRDFNFFEEALEKRGFIWKPCAKCRRHNNHGQL